MRILFITCCLLFHNLAYGEDLGGVAGEIRAGDGKPAEGVRVAVAFAEEQANGVFVPVRYVSAVGATDNFGRYRLTNVTPGRYFLFAGRIDNPTYYPGTKSATDAMPVTIPSGSMVDGMNFELVLPPGAKLSGRIIANGVKLPRRVALFPSGPTWFREDVDVRSDGSFIFRGISPGSYSLSAFPDAVLWNASAIIVKDKDVTATGLAAVPWVQPRGWVEVERGGPWPRFWLELRGKSGKAQGSIGTISETGVSFMNLPAGDYRIDIRDLPKEYRVESFTYGKTNLLKNPIRIVGGVQQFALKLSIAQPDKLRRIRGRVVGVENLSTTSHVTLSGPSLLKPMPTPIERDGSYDFSNVRTGTYTLQAGQSEPTTVDVSDKDVQGIDLFVPAIRQLHGKVVVADGGPVPMFGITFSKGSRVVGYGYQRPQGTFEASIPEGELSLSVSVPRDIYEIEAITFGASDLLKNPMHVQGIDLPELVVKLAIRKPTFRVTGRVVDATGRASVPAFSPIVLLSNKSLIIKETIAPDGSFEFSKVPSGTYTLSSSGYTQTALIVVDQDIQALEIGPRLATSSSGSTVPPATPPPSSDAEANETLIWVRGRVTGSPGELPSKITLSNVESGLDSNGQFDVLLPPGIYSAYAGNYVPTVPSQIVVGAREAGRIDLAVPVQRQVRGRVIVDGDGPLPRARFRAIPVTASGGASTGIQSDGTFVIALPDGEFQVELMDVASPYRVKSIRYGLLDLMHQKLKVTAESSQEIVVTLEAIPPVQWARVTGHVTGGELPASAKVVLIGNPDRYFLESRIDKDQTFLLPKVPRGRYTLKTEPPAFGMADRMVSIDQEESALDLNMPQQRSLTVRVQVEGGGRRGGLSFSLRQLDGKGFQFVFPAPLSVPIKSGRVDMECSSDVCGNAWTRLLNEPVVLAGSTPESFTLRLPEGEYRMAVEYMTEGASLKSMTFGSTNLMRETFNLSGENSPELIITLTNSR